jgi:hypothetical protein
MTPPHHCTFSTQTTFSEASFIQTPDRTRLSPERFKELLILHTNREQLPSRFRLDWSSLASDGLHAKSFLHDFSG